MAQTEAQRNRERKEREFIVTMIITDRAKNKRIKDIFASMNDEVEKELNNYFAKYSDGDTGTAQNWQQRADKADIDRLKRIIDNMLAVEDNAARNLNGDELTEEATNEVKAIEVSSSMNRVAALQLFIGLQIIKGMSNYQKIVADVLESSAVNEFERQSILWGKAVGKEFVAKDINEIVYDTFVNATWEEKVWGVYQDELRSDVERLVRRGVINGENPKKLAKDLAEKYDVTRKQAEMLMRTEQRRVQTTAQLKAYQIQGFKQYLYIAEPDACGKCLPLDDGEPFDIAGSLIGTDLPPMHPNCRCSTTPYMDNPIKQ